jgi:hypothetical protein
LTHFEKRRSHEWTNLHGFKILLNEAKNIGFLTLEGIIS